MRLWMIDWTSWMGLLMIQTLQLQKSIFMHSYSWNNCKKKTSGMDLLALLIPVTSWIAVILQPSPFKTDCIFQNLCFPSPQHKKTLTWVILNKLCFILMFSIYKYILSSKLYFIIIFVCCAETNPHLPLNLQEPPLRAQFILLSS